MLKAERLQLVYSICAENGSASVKDISEQLGVSEMTARRDLTELAAAGKVVRIHGGARMPGESGGIKLSRVLTHAEKSQEHIDKKRVAARLAAERVCEGDSIFLGGGTTVECMVDYLPTRNIRVVTSSMPVFSALAKREYPEIYLTGGVYSRSTEILKPIDSASSVRSLACDKAFVGATGVFQNEIFGSDPQVVCLLRSVLDNSRKRYLLIDSHKVGRRDFFSFYPLARFDTVFCDPQISLKRRHSIDEHTLLVTE